MEIKTNAMRLLDKQKAVYRSYRYDSAVALSGIEVATVLGQNPKQVFKTLVTDVVTGVQTCALPISPLANRGKIMCL